MRDHLSSKYGPLLSVYHYSIPSKGKSGPPACPIAPTGGEFHWLLAEFERKEDFAKAITSCGNVEGTVPYTSPMTWFKNSTASQKDDRKSTIGTKGKKKTTSEVSRDMDGIESEKLIACTSLDFGTGNNVRMKEVFNIL